MNKNKLVRAINNLKMKWKQLNMIQTKTQVMKKLRKMERRGQDLEMLLKEDGLLYAKDIFTYIYSVLFKKHFYSICRILRLKAQKAGQQPKNI
ncbi:hypothetical protein BpHYR1_048419 [Brachionus plicatilis]|uniref:Uncharacterized protein n=1 Tax=Brachionus plicatilis TaxID=10195 RepID=A0A3M7Q852_BRAPC|nr:hypothetical protein BpHYR1_048419 [Brachionus plicatilis]